MKPRPAALALLLLLRLLSGAADDIAGLCTDRAAMERVYHAHRTGTKQPFEQAMPPAMLEGLVRADLHKEAVLRKTYGVEITPEMLAAEVQRIQTTTRAPEMLAEIKQALGGDAARFARTMARPILVERELRSRFDNDDRIHAEKRRQAEQARASLLAGQPVAGMQTITWQLTPRPAESPAPTAPPPPAPETARSSTYSVEARAQVVPAGPTPPAASGEADRPKHYFEELEPQLQNVLRVQLQKPGDVSALVETPGGFLVFQAKERTAEALTVAALSLPRRSYEEWLAQQANAGR